MKTLAERLSILIESTKSNDAKFAAIVGVNRAKVSKYKSKVKPYYPGFITLSKIIESFPNLNARWLLTGEGDMWLGDTGNNVVEEKLTNYNKESLLQSRDLINNQISTIKNDETMESELVLKLVSLLEKQQEDIRYALTIQHMLASKLPNLGEQKHRGSHTG